MPNPDAQRKEWNQAQKAFRQVLLSGEQHKLAIELGLRQHAQLHAAAIADPSGWSFADALFSGLTEAHARHILPRGEHAIAWLIWHLARIEDVAMSMLVAGTSQVLIEGGWQKQLEITAVDTGNAMPAATIAAISRKIDIPVLRAYRQAVGTRTREIISALTAADLNKSVDASRLQQVASVGAVVPEASGLLDYWGRRTIAGLLLMPATRHNMVHLNEALQLKAKVGRVLPS